MAQTSSVTAQLVTTKNQWLHQQIDVQYPTPDSVQGYNIYQAMQQETSCIPFQPRVIPDTGLDQVYVADFHRLTIMFALLQSDRCGSEADKNAVIEFFTQIILSPPCELVLVFEGGEPIAVGLYTQGHGEGLISDIVVRPNQLFPLEIDVASAIYHKIIQKNGTLKACWLETQVTENMS